MATEVLRSFDDFVLFPQQRDDVYLNLQDPFSNARLDQIYENMASNFPQDFAGLGSFYDPYHQEPGMTTGDPRYYEAPRSRAEEVPSRHGTSTSPSVSVSQSLDHLPSNFSHTSAASGHSTASSAVGSPYSQHQSIPAGQDQWVEMGLGIAGNMASTDLYPAPGSYQLTSAETDGFDDKFPGSFVDPTLLSSFDRPAPMNAPASPYPNYHLPTNYPTPMVQPASPAPSDVSSHGSHRNSIISRPRHASPYLYNPYPAQSRMGRRGSLSSHSRFSHESPRSVSLGLEDEGNQRGRCPFPECGRQFKDLKAHMLTHQSERPEKCPIVTCEYHTKGFARKYDRCRHTLTHYKGTMVCDFCPNSGSAAEKSFNRADTFKRHLTSVHGVEQSPPNSRKKTPSAAKKSGKSEEKNGKCSTCSSTFSNAQEFYDHLDDCVLKYLDKGEPSEKVNEQRLTEINEDLEVKETLERHMLPTELETITVAPEQHSGAEDEEEDDGEEDDEADATWNGSNSRSGKGSIKSNKKDSS